MAFNIMDLVQEQLTPDNIGALAGLLGEDEKKTASGISGAVPAILGGLLGTVGKPEGRKAFGAAVDDADAGLLDNVAGMLGGSGSSSMVSSGLKTMSSLFGENKTGLLASAISGFSGLSSGSTKSLLGVAASLIISMLAKKKKQDKLDTAGLVDMLTTQKGNISKAMPADLGKALGGSGILDDLMSTAGAGADAVASAARSATAGAQQAAQKSKSMFSRLLPLIVIALVAWYAFQYFGKPKPAEEAAGPATAPVEQVQAPVEQVQETTSAAKQVGEAAMQTLTVDNIDLGKELTALFDATGKALTGITDVESARNAVEEIGKVNQALDVVSSLAANLPPEGRQMLSEIITKLAPGLDKAIAAAYAIPDVGNVIGDSVNSLLQKLSALAKA